jgi:hypothetical protein
MTGQLRADGPGTTGQLLLKWDTHFPNYLLVHIYKTGQHAWKIPEGTRMTVDLRIDNARSLRYAAVGHGDLIEIGINLNDVDPATGEKSITLLTNLLSAGVQLSVFFVDYLGETYWTVPLTGSTAEIAQFDDCIRTITAAAKDTGSTGDYQNQQQAHQGRTIPSAPQTIPSAPQPAPSQPQPLPPTNYRQL